MEKAEKILETGQIPPAKPLAFLSLNRDGQFDDAYEDGPVGNRSITGRSYTPNVFLTNFPPNTPIDVDLGPRLGYEYYIFLVTPEEIIEQNLRVFPNPSTEFSFVFNVPMGGEGNWHLDIEVERAIFQSGIGYIR